MSERMSACGIDVMDNRRARGMIPAMSGLRLIIPRLLMLMLVLAVFAGAAGLGTIGHAAPQSDSAHGHHHMHGMSGTVHGTPDSPGGLQTTQADCTMAGCCFSDGQAPCADHPGVMMSACFAGVAASPALQPAPDRADKPPRRT